MPRSNYQRHIERDLRAKCGDPSITLPRFLLETGEKPVAWVAEYLDVPVDTVKKWRSKYLVRSYTLREPASAGR